MNVVIGLACLLIAFVLLVCSLRRARNDPGVRLDPTYEQELLERQAAEDDWRERS